jgi:hypothetical protein
MERRPTLVTNMPCLHVFRCDEGLSAERTWVHRGRSQRKKSIQHTHRDVTHAHRAGKKQDAFGRTCELGGRWVPEPLAMNGIVDVRTASPVSADDFLGGLRLRRVAGALLFHFALRCLWRSLHLVYRTPMHDKVAGGVGKGVDGWAPSSCALATPHECV